MDINVGCRVLEIIDIRRTDFAYILGVSRDEVGELRIDLEGRRSCGGDPWNLVDGVGQPLHLRLPATIDTPDCVRERLHTGVHLGRQRPLAEVHDRTADNQIFVELVLQVRSEEALALHGERALVLQFDIHVRTGLQNGGVEDGHCSHGVVHGIIDVLDEGRTSGSHRNRTSRHVHGA